MCGKQKKKKKGTWVEKQKERVSSKATEQGGSTTGRAIDDMSELRVTRDLGHGERRKSPVAGAGSAGVWIRHVSSAVSPLGPTHPFAS